MSGQNNWGIRRKLFSIVVFILICHIVLLLFMGSTLFEWFYLNNKISELESSANRIRAAYQENSETFYDEISAVENENALVSLISIATVDGQEALSYAYHSRSGKGRQDDPIELPKELPPFMAKENRRRDEQLLERLKVTDESDNVQTGNEEEPWNNAVSLSTRLDDNFYLVIQTPRDYIRSTADLAVKYTALLSMGILLVGSVVIYFVVGRIAKPIQKIQEVAQQISKMDFSKKCEVRGGDEIAMLAVSINHMSSELQASIGRLVQANEVLQNDLVRQQQTDRMRQQFVANVSHDFKTPLTLMISYAEALAAGDLAESDREYCNIIISEGNRLSRMVGRLLELSKLESGVDQLEISIFCLSEVLDAVIKSHRILTEKRGITVRKELADEFIVSADYLKIQQVVNNLFENAIKYTADGGRITLTVRQDGESCRVCVENPGDHIAGEDIGSIFDSFYRADKSRTRADGYGLGLAIVKVVMEAHRQPYGVENIPDGVRFWFDLSLADMGPEESEDDES